MDSYSKRGIVKVGFRNEDILSCFSQKFKNLTIKYQIFLWKFSNLWMKITHSNKL